MGKWVLMHCEIPSLFITWKVPVDDPRPKANTSLEVLQEIKSADNSLLNYFNYNNYKARLANATKLKKCGFS